MWSMLTSLKANLTSECDLTVCQLILILLAQVASGQFSHETTDQFNEREIRYHTDIIQMAFKSV